MIRHPVRQLMSDRQTLIDAIKGRQPCTRQGCEEMRKRKLSDQELGSLYP